MKKMTHVALLLTAVMLLSGCSLLPEEERVKSSPVIRQFTRPVFKTAQVTRGDMIQTLKVSCKYVPVQTVSLGFALGGEYIDRFFVEVGDQVQQGQLLGQLRLDDLEEAVSSLPSGVELVAVPEYMYLLSCFMEKDLSKYIDYDKKDVQFNTDSMKRAMDAARKYGRPNPEIKERSISRALYSESGFTEVLGLYLGGEDMEGTDLGPLLYEGKIAMEEVKIPSLFEYNFYRGLMEKSGKLVGYPTSDGNGIAEDPVLSLAIVSSTEYKEQAWEIIRSFYSDEAQRIVTNGQAIDHGGFPMRKSTFDTKCEEEITKINLAYDAYLKALQEGKDAGEHIYFQAPEDLGEELKGIIDGVKTACKTDSVTDIIQEEMAGYFQDSRSADEVLDTISNRVRQVIQER